MYVQRCRRRLLWECALELWVNGAQGTETRWGRGLKSSFCWDPTLHRTTLWSTYVTSFNSPAAPGDGSQPPLRTLDT